MRRAAALTLTTTIGVLSFASSALALSDFPTAIPNGGVECKNCHPNDLDKKIVGPFGQSLIDNGLCDPNGNIIQPKADWWPLLYKLDADGDKQTNGEELGDPCGDW